MRKRRRWRKQGVNCEVEERERGRERGAGVRIPPELSIQIRFFQPVVLIKQVLRSDVVQIGAVDSQRIEVGYVMPALLVGADDGLNGEMIFHFLHGIGGRRDRRSNRRSNRRRSNRRQSTLERPIKDQSGRHARFDLLTSSSSS